MDVDGDSNFGTQVRRGLLPYCVLALLADQECYGVQIVRELGAVDGMVISEGTIYPLLSRLRRQGLVDTRWGESPSGPPRRYYRITATGRTSLAAFSDDWRRVRAAVDHFLAGPS
ncbi:MAG: PadR family transcriptional regulator [Actinocatenispora sp.]